MGRKKFSNMSKDERIDASINEMICLAEKLGRCPTVYEYEFGRENGLCRKALENSLCMKYYNICKEYLSNYKQNPQKIVISEDELKIMIENVKYRIGRLPMAKELHNYGLPGFKVLWKNFGMTYNQLIESWGWEPIGSTTLTKTKDEMLSDFYDLYCLLQRVPTVRELNDKENGTVAHSTYTKYFGSVENVCRLLDIDYDVKLGGSGRTCRDMNGDVCRSISEVIISNFLIVNGVRFEKGNSYSEILDGDNRQFDWKIFLDKEIYYVEYFGLFDCDPKTSVTKRYFKRTKKKVKDLYSAGIADKCIFIFPWDYNNKRLSVIFAPYLGGGLKDIEVSQNFIYTNDEILNKIMPYADNPDGDYLPSTVVLVKRNQPIYDEIINKHGSYASFAERVGKKVCSKSEGYWTKEKMFNTLVEIMNKYGELPQKRNRDLCKFDKREMRSIECVYGRINMKLMFFEQCISEGIIIPSCEMVWIRNVVNNKGSGMGGRITEEQQLVATKILDKMKHIPNT